MSFIYSSITSGRPPKKTSGASRCYGRGKELPAAAVDDVSDVRLRGRALAALGEYREWTLCSNQLPVWDDICFCCCWYVHGKDEDVDVATAFGIRVDG